MVNTANEKASGRDPGGFDNTTNSAESTNAVNKLKALFGCKGHAAHNIAPDFTGGRE